MIFNVKSRNSCTMLVQGLNLQCETWFFWNSDFRFGFPMKFYAKYGLINFFHTFFSLFGTGYYTHSSLHISNYFYLKNYMIKKATPLACRLEIISNWERSAANVLIFYVHEVLMIGVNFSPKNFKFRCFL